MTMVRRASGPDAGVRHPPRPHPTEFAMTASFNPSQPVSRGPSPASAAVVGLIAGFTVLALITPGVTFLGLPIAFPIAVSVAQAYHLPVSAAPPPLPQP